MTKKLSLIEWEFVRGNSTRQRGSINSVNHRFAKTIVSFKNCVIRTRKDKSVYLSFLPAAGYRNNSNGALNNRGYNGNYWSTRMNDASNAYNMNFNSSSTNMNNNNRTNGFSVRCIAKFIINN